MSTAVPPGTCVTHGWHGQPFCPRCSTSTLQPGTFTAVTPDPEPTTTVRLIARLRAAQPRYRELNSPLYDAIQDAIEHIESLTGLLYRLLDYQHAGFNEHHARGRAHRDRAAAAPVAYERITHGRHCACTACARQDWADPRLVACGMHGPDCPPRYQPFGGAGQWHDALLAEQA